MPPQQDQQPNGSDASNTQQQTPQDAPSTPQIPTMPLSTNSMQAKGNKKRSLLILAGITIIVLLVGIVIFVPADEEATNSTSLTTSDVEQTQKTFENSLEPLANELTFVDAAAYSRNTALRLSHSAEEINTLYDNAAEIIKSQMSKEEFLRSVINTTINMPYSPKFNVVVQKSQVLDDGLTHIATVLEVTEAEDTPDEFKYDKKMYFNITASLKEGEQWKLSGVEISGSPISLE